MPGAETPCEADPLSGAPTGCVEEEDDDDDGDETASVSTGVRGEDGTNCTLAVADVAHRHHGQWKVA